MRLIEQISFQIFNISRFYIVAVKLYVARYLVILMFSDSFCRRLRIWNHVANPPPNATVKLNRWLSANLAIANSLYKSALYAILQDAVKGDLYTEN